MNNRFLWLMGIMNWHGAHVANFFYPVQCDDFPRQVELGMRSVGWLESDINEWIDSRAKKIDPKEAQQ